ncbi:MAG: 3-phosphoshikimate 1-carboxyvinyltransferase [Oscillospiraceae bacterium]|nr:3-phosphoshikimate 1-carboxyvinyltransferase [Oscillospiraceae bacterium]
MADVKIQPSSLNGTVTVPPSKSDCHRAIICAALAKGKSTVAPVSMSQDIKATISCINSLGAKTDLKGDTLTIDSSHLFYGCKANFDCCESGSTLRFFIPVAGALSIDGTFTGKGLLPQRPIGIYLDTLPKQGVNCKTEGGLPLEISGELKSGTFEIPGNVSSQFVTGLLLALPLLEGDSKIVITTPMESVGYINMTIDTMKRFGVTVEVTDYGYFVKGNQQYTPQNYTVQGDWSQAAFFMVAGALGGEITIKGIDTNSTQGDKEICRIIEKFGADVQVDSNSVTVKKGNLKGINIDARQIPDLVPVLAVCAAGANGTTKIYNAERLRIKESDRLNTTANAINNLGGMVAETHDGLLIQGIGTLRSGKAEGSNDHRIVMASAIASVIATGEVTITDSQAINKSYPDFFEDFRSLGGNVNVINNR